MTPTLLIVPHSYYFQSYLEAIEEGFEHGESKMVTTFEELDIHTGSTPWHTPDGIYVRVPANHFWLVRGDKFIGAIDIRANNDNPIIAQYGGNIGYGIRPSERKNGYGTLILNEGLKICRGMGLGLIRITTTNDNRGSQKIILNNGGQLIKKVRDLLVFEILLYRDVI